MKMLKQFSFALLFSFFLILSFVSMLYNYQKLLSTTWKHQTTNHTITAMINNRDSLSHCQKTMPFSICLFTPWTSWALSTTFLKGKPTGHHCPEPLSSIFLSRNVQLVFWHVSVHMDGNWNNKFGTMKFPIAMSLRPTERPHSFPFCPSVLKPNFYLNFTEL